MEINNKISFNNIQQSSKQVRNSEFKTKPVTSDSVSFTAHTKGEMIYKKGFVQLIHQTAFNREPKTKQFVCDYIQKYFGHKDNIKIVSAGCSTGEEAVTYSMLLYPMRDKVDILGFDLGKKAIKEAQSRKYIFEIPNKNFDFNQELEIPTPYTDTYLLSDTNKGLSTVQTRFKSLFKEFFEPTNEKIKKPFGERIRDLITKRNGYTPMQLERKSYKLKDGMAENCKFIQGDVLEIDKILNGEKADVISFSNALYHLTTDSMCGVRSLKKDAEQTIENLMTKFKNCLNNNGIVVFGENEGVQIANNEVVPKVMKRLGFTPLNETAEHSANVWKINK